MKADIGYRREKEICRNVWDLNPGPSKREITEPEAEVVDSESGLTVQVHYLSSGNVLVQLIHPGP